MNIITERGRQTDRQTNRQTETERKTQREYRIRTLYSIRTFEGV